MKIERNKLTSKEFLKLYKSAGWDSPLEEQVEIALKNSIITFSIYLDNEVVGMARLIGDKAMTYYIKDLVVNPNNQHKGIGSLLLNEIEKYIMENISMSWAVSLELISSNEGIDFYKNKGFIECPCEFLGSGMIKMIRKN